MKIYHYTNVESLAMILKNKTIRFNRLDKVDDIEEGNAESSGVRFCKYVFVSCWTENPEESIPLNFEQLLIGALFTALNTLIGLIISGYATSNFLLADVSIILSTGLIYLLLDSKASDGFKIGLSYIFCFAGIGRLVCMIATSPEMKNNMAIICAIALLLFEIVCLATAIIIEKNLRT
jgi:hypothetical protein